MKKPDRFLVAILALAVFLVAVSLIAVVLQRRTAEPPPEAGTPARVVWDYQQALNEGRYADAAALIAPPYPPDAAEFAAVMGRQRGFTDRVDRVRIGETTINDGRATVTVRVYTVNVSGPLSQSVYERPEVVRLKKVGGEWRITSYFYPYWRRDWEMKPGPPRGPTGGD